MRHRAHVSRGRVSRSVLVSRRPEVHMIIAEPWLPAGATCRPQDGHQDLSCSPDTQCGPWQETSSWYCRDNLHFSLFNYSSLGTAYTSSVSATWSHATTGRGPSCVAPASCARRGGAPGRRSTASAGGAARGHRPDGRHRVNTSFVQV